MMTRKSRSLGVCVLGWIVISSNALLYLVYYFDLRSISSVVMSRSISFVSMLAVFPNDFFNGYFSAEWLPQMMWVIMVVICAFGILLLSKFSRAVFIILNIIHVVTLAYLVILHFGSQDFLDFIFRLYFTAVASGSYIAYLVLPEVREQFRIETQGLRLQILLQKPLGKKVRPADSKKHAGLSTAYFRLGRYEEAVDSLMKALEGEPENADYYFRLGMIYIKQRVVSKAIEVFKKAIALDPLHYEAYYNLGILYVQQGCSGEAIQIFLKAANVRPNEPQIYRDLGDAYFSAGKYQEAVECFKKSSLLSRKDAYAYYRMGCIQTEYLDQHQQALEALRAAIRIEEKFCDTHFQLGKVCIKLKHYKEAVRAFKDVIRLQEDHVQGHYYLGFVYCLLKDKSSARKQCDFLKRYDMDLAENLLMLLSA